MISKPFDLRPDVFQRREHHEVFTRMRAEDPVHRYVRDDGPPFWCFSKHADVEFANRDVETFTVTRASRSSTSTPTRSRGR